MFVLFPLMFIIHHISGWKCPWTRQPLSSFRIHKRFIKNRTTFSITSLRMLFLLLWVQQLIGTLFI